MTESLWGAIIGGAIALLSSIVTTYIFNKWKQQEEFKKKKAQIYEDFLTLKNVTKGLINTPELWHELKSLDSDIIDKNCNLLARAELYLEDSIVDKMRELVETLGLLESQRGRALGQKSNVEKSNRLMDEILDMFRNDLKIKSR